MKRSVAAVTGSSPEEHERSLPRVSFDVPGDVSVVVDRLGGCLADAERLHAVLAVPQKGDRRAFAGRAGSDNVAVIVERPRIGEASMMSAGPPAES